MKSNTMNAGGVGSIFHPNSRTAMVFRLLLQDLYRLSLQRCTVPVVVLIAVRLTKYLDGKSSNST